MLIQKYLSVEEFLSSCSLKMCYLVVSGEAKRFAQPCLGDSEEFLEIKKKIQMCKIRMRILMSSTVSNLPRRL